ncbi:unnamed protein product [Adineta steineri]|uniref:Uncharacterized protein n=1 Tax=Adineta steineri TaxID=433720 RepID=A0A819E7U4_9BILA|nr:unnamed protein product [Adineta steineri]CAF1160396.1 unnamed protein product [Adineta steineri]CAF3846895.1 unnamed protein product [Adineta steineri]CAF4108033.1 unnamed protein product [Adineta steineri]
MLKIQLLLIATFILYNIQTVNSIVCYQCTDCPEPFTSNYPYVTITNNTNFLAQCTKTIVTLGDGSRLISKGSVFFCPTTTSTADIQMYCCGSDYCNSSFRLGPSLFLSLFILTRIYF